MSKSQLCNFSYDNTNMITFVLKRKWFEKIASGEKTIEFRECKKYWNTRIRIKGSVLEPIENGYLIHNTLTKCILSNGYTANKLYADIEKIEIWLTKENDLNTNPVYAIFLKNIRRTE